MLSSSGIRKIFRSGPVYSLPFLFATPSFASAPQPEIGLTGQSFANEATATSRVDLNLSWQSDRHLYEGMTAAPGVAAREFHFHSFFESGKQGDRSLDVDNTAVRIGTGAGEFAGHLWIGRTHPLLEGSVSRSVPSTSAIGANWVQNQSNALEPRVAGWIGAGFHARNKFTGLFITVAGSPIYFPSFGPKVTFSENADTEGSRFARLPPQYVDLNGQLFPLRYLINTGNLRDIVLQNQYFAAVGRADEYTEFQLMTWSAPNPNPKVDAEALLRIQSEHDLDVLVNAHPSFPRQNFVGAQWALTGVAPNPTFQAVYERQSKKFTLSAQFQLQDFIKGGVLHTLDSEVRNTDLNASPDYAKALVWGEVSTGNLFAHWKPSFRLEQHLGVGRSGQWVKPSLRYSAGNGLGAIASANIITGQDSSYFGTWRSLDSVSLGVNYLW